VKPGIWPSIKVSGPIVVIALMAIAAVVTAPAELVNRAPTLEIQGNIEEWLAIREQAVGHVDPIIPGTEKRIRWFRNRPNTRTQYSIVYLHGFSATRQEIAPVGELLSDALQANLFETRLTGHGLRQNALVGISAEDWLADTAEALAVGAAIGEEIIIMGTSTGATLALAFAGHSSFDDVSHVILISPNFGPRDLNAELLTWPGGRQLAHLLVGKTHSWTPSNELQDRYWASTYPMDALVEMIRLVDYPRSKLPLQLEQTVLAIYSPSDNVVDVSRITAAFEQLDSPRKQLLALKNSGDPGSHILAGDIMSPQTNQQVVEQITRFVEPGVRGTD